jgi:hypothetical protein
MPVYDSKTFSQPAPVANVTLINPQNGIRQLDVPMLLDTGADITLVPQFSVDELNIDWSTAQEIELTGFDDHKSISRVLRLNLVFGGKTFRGKYPVIDQEYGIIGRNILNLCRIEYDGQKLNWEIL